MLYQSHCIVTGLVHAIHFSLAHQSRAGIHLSILNRDAYGHKRRSCIFQQVDVNELIHRQQIHMRMRRYGRMDGPIGRMDGPIGLRHAPMFPNQYGNRDREPVKREVRHSRVNIDGDIIR